MAPPRVAPRERSKAARELERWRLAWGWTQEQAGLWYGLKVSSAGRTWRRWENGERRIPGPLGKRILEKGWPPAQR